jgi:aspartate carbamoyltransferase catalytic subunit
MEFSHSHLLSTKQLSKQDLEIIFDEAMVMEKVLSGELDGSKMLT